MHAPNPSSKNIITNEMNNQNKSNTIDLHHYVFPVMGSDSPFETTSPKDLMLYGTCFSVRNGLFLTAAHVVKAIQKNKFRSVYVWGGESYIAYYFDTYELFEDYDLAVIKIKNVPNINVKEFKWKTDTLLVTSLVSSIGFALGFDVDSNALSLRGFTGFVISVPTYCKQVKAKPKAYELSFSAPSDLSGAPLLSKDNLHIYGHVIGMFETKIQIDKYEEVVKENNVSRITEAYNCAYWTIAISSEAIVSIHSKLLNKTIGDYLKDSNLLS